MAEQVKSTRNKANERLRQSLVNLYIKAGRYMLITILIFLGVDLFTDTEITKIQSFVGFFTLAGIGVPVLFSKKSWLKNAIIYIHITLVVGVITVYAIDYILEPEIDQLLTLFLGIYMAGLVIVRTSLTIWFFAGVSVLIGYIFITNDVFDVKFTVYYLIMASTVIGVNYWRESLYINAELSNETYKTLFSQSSELIFVLNKDLEIIELNKAAEEFVLKHGESSVINQKFNTVFCGESEEDLTNFEKSLIKLYNGEKSVQFEANCDFKQNQQFIPKEFTCSTADYFNQEVIIVAIRIISERKRYEQQLIEGKEKMGQILENINSFVFNISYETDGTTLVNFVSEKVEEIYGIDIDDYVTRVKSSRVSELFHPEDRERVNQEFEEMLNACESKTIKFRIIRDGKVRWIEEKFFPKRQAGITTISLFGIVSDVTEREEGYQKIEESEKRYRQIFERNLAGVYKTHVDGTIIDCNPAFAKILGFDSPKELINKNVSSFYIEQTDRTPYIEKLRKEGFLNNYISRLKTKDGRQVILSNNVSIFPDESGKLNLIEGTLIDITERNEYEKELKSSRLSFKNIVDHSPAAILIFSKDTMVYMNPLGKKLFDELLNTKAKSMLDVFPASIRFVVKDLLEDAKNDINSYTEIDLGKGKKKKKYSINIVNTIYDNRESQLFLLRDITLQNEYNVQKLRAELAEETNKMLQEEIARHKLTQASLIEKTSKLNALFEGSGNLHIISLDKKFRITGHNNNFERFVNKELGKRVELGKPFLSYFKTSVAAKKSIENRFIEVFNGKPLEMISHFPGKDREFWMESFINPIVIGKEINEISFISHNITEKIETEQKVKLSELNNRAILLAMPDMLFKVNKEGYFTDAKISNENDRKLLQQVTNTLEFTGKKISEVFSNEVIAKEFEENIAKALDSDEVLTHTYQFYYGEKSAGNKIYFENRYSKTTNEEVIIIVRNITESMEYEEKLVESVNEKEILLKEVHHRVKNNLQVINSILNLQSSYITDEKTLEIINESQNRIRSMSYIHEILYQTKDFSAINFADYVTNLVQNIVHSYELYNDGTDLELNIEPVKLALDQAIPCGLIINELVSNSLKYAYPSEVKGKIVVNISERDGKVSMEIEDFGVGLPQNFDLEQTDSLGLSLVHTLVEQLDGELILKTKGGTKFLIIFEKQQF